MLWYVAFWGTPVQRLSRGLATTVGTFLPFRSQAQREPSDLKWTSAAIQSTAVTVGFREFSPVVLTSHICLCAFNGNIQSIIHDMYGIFKQALIKVHFTLGADWLVGQYRPAS